MTYSPLSSPLPPPSNTRYEVYTQNGPMALGDGLYLSEKGEIVVNLSDAGGNINGGTF